MELFDLHHNIIQPGFRICFKVNESTNTFIWSEISNAKSLSFPEFSVLSQAGAIVAIFRAINLLAYRIFCPIIPGSSRFLWYRLSLHLPALIPARYKKGIHRLFDGLHDGTVPCRYSIFLGPSAVLTASTFPGFSGRSRA